MPRHMGADHGEIGLAGARLVDDFAVECHTTSRSAKSGAQRLASGRCVLGVSNNQEDGLMLLSTNAHLHARRVKRMQNTTATGGRVSAGVRRHTCCRRTHHAIARSSLRATP